MKRTRRDVEAELKLLIPQAPSDRVTAHIADRLEPARWAHPSSTMWRWAVAVLALAAAITVLVWRRPLEQDLPIGQPPITVAKQPLSVTPEAEALSLLAYRRVLEKSPEDLDRVLDVQANAVLAVRSVNDRESLYQQLMAN